MEPVPPNWAVDFLVESIDGYANKSQKLGCKILAHPATAGEMGKFSVLEDPQGGAFTVMQFDGPVTPLLDTRFALQQFIYGAPLY